MEKKIRRRFILSSSAAVLLMLLVVIGMIVLISYFRIYSIIYSELEYLSENGGQVPDYQGKRLSLDGFYVTPESQYELRYFSVMISDGEILSVDLSHIAAVSGDGAESLVTKALGRKSDRGTIIKNSMRYVYEITDLGTEGKLIVFLDCTRTLQNVWETIRLALMIGLFSFLFFCLVISIFSKRAVKTTIKNIEAQNEFITNAGHELKTPLAIISANTEVLEIMTGKNEWTESIVNQVKRMSNLVSELIFLAKMNEKADIVLRNINFSEITQDVTLSFKPVIEQQNKKLICDIKENVEIKGDDKILGELVSILVDNAAKYCDEGGTVRVTLKRRIRDTGARLVVSNTYAEGKNIDYSRFFNRFYREDTSHNSKKKGYGIGLSMAEGIVATVKGKINISYSNDEISFNVII